MRKTTRRKPPGLAAPKRTRAAYDEERSAATRVKILEATFECLHDLGHGGASTVEVCKRAGIERGTLLHHFPDRATLLASALEHVFEKRRAEFLRRADRLQEERARGKPGAVAIELLWKAVDAPSTVVWLELVVAARTDPSLHRALVKMGRAFDEKIQATFAELFPEDAASEGPFSSLRVPFAFALMNGLVLDRLAGFGARVPSVLDYLERLAELG
ncbi:MAG TPA: TetR/AcrR family transcriptional regulator [Polyangiaceae bacterium]|nr:TetR/AcrR family transcriptional regulator [Polyangiaceae bacterium]